MKTTFNFIDIIYTAVAGLSVSGAVYKQQRPLGSKLEDVVINALPVTADQVQSGFVNVNIYVPDFSVNIGGQVQFQPNLSRLRKLAAEATTLLKEGYADTYGFWIVNQTTIQEPDINQHYINIRIQFTNHQI